MSEPPANGEDAEEGDAGAILVWNGLVTRMRPLERGAAGGAHDCAGVALEAPNSAPVAETDRTAALLSAFTTEHFALEGRRAATISESSARAALYLGSLSSGVLTLGFVAQVSDAGDLFYIFALILLPTLYILGLFTFARLVENSVEDILCGRAVNRIRRYYQELAGPDARYFMLPAHDDVAGVLGNMGLGRPRWQLYFTVSSAIAAVNSIVGGAALGLAVGIATESAAGSVRRSGCRLRDRLGRGAHELQQRAATAAAVAFAKRCSRPRLPPSRRHNPEPVGARRDRPHRCWSRRRSPRGPCRAQGRGVHRLVRVLLADRGHREAGGFEGGADIRVRVEVLPVLLAEGVTVTGPRELELGVARAGAGIHDAADHEVVPGRFTRDDGVGRS